MKKIINGKKYDTDTATKLASWNNGLSTTDFRCCKETLYRKKTGEFFLHGEGGAMSRWAERCNSNSWCEGEDVEPLTEAGARAWVEAHANERYEEIFGECEE